MSHPSLVNENFASNIREKFTHECLSSEVFPMDYYDGASGNISLERFVTVIINSTEIWVGISFSVLRLGLIFLISCGGVRLNPLGTSATIWPVVPAQDDEW
jgi:hypothetical protein